MNDQQKCEAWADLMRASLAGGDAAYRQLLGELALAFRAQARAALGRAGHGNGDVEDIVQDALLAVHLKRETWDPTRPLAPWAFAVLRYKMLDHLRQKKSRPTEPLEQHLDIAGADPEGAAAFDAGRLLASLAAPQRQLVVALAVEGRTAAEVANTIGSTEGAVRVALHRALKKLTQLYREARE